MIDCADDELHPYRGRRRGKRVRHGRTGHADRAEIVGVVMVRLARLVVSRCDRRDHDINVTSLALAVDRVNVTKRQGKIDGERNQRRP